MMVWKSVISPVGFKVEASTNGGPVKEVKVSNTLTNQWELITFNLSDCIGYSYPRIVIFPDFPDTRTSGTTVYLDNITQKETTTVVDIIVNSPDHTTLETAVVAAGLADDLSGDGPFTVFAPTDDAFAALPEGTLDALLEDPTGALADILLYHVVSGKAMSTDLSDGQMITTLLGKDVTVTINGEGVFINDAKVTVADLVADNGVVHVIDAVLLPPATGIFNNKDDHKELNIFPNPASDRIRLSGLNNGSEGQLRIVNISGAVVLNTYLNNTLESIDISSLDKGAYFLMLDTKEGSYSEKFFVE